MIKGIRPQLLQMGSIKIGRKGAMKTTANNKQFQMPEKLNHFIITTQERGPDNNFIPNTELMDRLKTMAKESKGDDPKPIIDQAGNLTGIPIRLLYDEIDDNFPTRYAAFVGTKCVCSGDGEIATVVRQDGRQEQRQCPCDWLTSTPPKCKPNGALTCIISCSDTLGGCFRFRTTSWNSISSILGSLHLIRLTTGGKLSFLPLHLVVSPKSVTLPTGQQSKISIVSVVFIGSIDKLHKAALSYATERAVYTHQIANVADAAALQIGFDDAPVPDPEEDDKDLAEEFYPETVVDQANARAMYEPAQKVDKTLAERAKEAGRAATKALMQEDIDRVKFRDKESPEPDGQTMAIRAAWDHFCEPMNKAEEQPAPGHIYDAMRKAEETETDHSLGAGKMIIEPAATSEELTSEPPPWADAPKTEDPAHQAVVWGFDPADRLGDEPGKKMLKKLHKAVTARGYDKVGVKLAMRRWEIHRIGESVRRPFDVESTDDILRVDAGLWEDMLDSLVQQNVLLTMIRDKEKQIPGFEGIVKKALAEGDPPVTVSHWYLMGAPRAISTAKSLDDIALAHMERWDAREPDEPANGILEQEKF